MDSNLAQKAVSLALEGQWEEAIKVNKELLKACPDDVETLNRLAKAYFESGNIKRAKSISANVLKFNPADPIANKNLSRWKSLTGVKKSCRTSHPAANFIEEPGKTKLVSLLNLGDKKVIAKLNAGDKVIITTHAHRVCVLTLDGKYLGRLPDDLAARLIRLTKYGNTYQVFLKSLEPESIRVFIREIFKAKKMARVQSFPPDVIRDLEPADEVPPHF